MNLALGLITLAAAIAYIYFLLGDRWVAHQETRHWIRIVLVVLNVVKWLHDGDKWAIALALIWVWVDISIQSDRRAS